MAAAKDFMIAMQKLYMDGTGTDITIVCQGTRKAVHTAVLVSRSPFFKAKVERWTNEKKEIVLDDCDPDVLAVVVDYMYGIDLPQLVDCFTLCKVLEVSELFLMADLKAEVEKLSIKIINKDNVKELCGGADNYRSKNLAWACADFMVKNGICLDGEEVKLMPDVIAACMVAYREKLKASNKELEAFRKALNSSKNELEASKKALNTSKRELEASKKALNTSKKELEASKKALKAAERELENNKLKNQGLRFGEVHRVVPLVSALAPWPKNESMRR